jgi:excisionase family DNA binding protein
MGEVYLVVGKNYQSRDKKKNEREKMKIHLILPDKYIEQIFEELFEKIKPILNDNKRKYMRGEIIYDVPRLSKYLKVSPKWIYEQTHLKTIPHFKVGNKQLRFRRKDIDQWLNTQRVPDVGNPTGRAKLLKGGKS